MDKSYPGGAQNVVVQSYGDPSLRQMMIRVPHVGEESGAALSTTKAQVLDALRKNNLPNFTEKGTEIVGPAVGKELRTRTLWATVLSLAGILAYLAFRFQFSFGVGAVVATIHDLLITLAFLAIFRYELSLNVIAALLTITGYSMNDTIVIYDRVRENMRSMRRDNISSVVNAAVNQMLDRTLITGGLTLLSVIALYFFGGEVLKGFAFTMIVGIITGTYSSVFIAAAIVVIWQGRTPMKTAPAAPVAPARKTGKRRAS
jgi:preprotein translocase subunit SecF